MTAGGGDTWIAVDWGTSNVRAWLMGSDGPLARAESASGMNRISPDDYEHELLDMVADWLDDHISRTVIVCGMAGARGGWLEAEYRSVPCRPQAARLVSVATTDCRINVHIIPGVCQELPHHDVMRGEETQIAGFLSDYGSNDDIVCLPGTHTKWVNMQNGSISSFRTFMSGEVHDLLGRHSILRLTFDSTSWDDGDFITAVEDSAANPAMINGSLFTLRASGLLEGNTTTCARSRAAGVLIGTELAAMKDQLDDRQISIIGGRELSRIYSTALNALGIESTICNAEACTLGGLLSAFRNMSS